MSQIIKDIVGWIVVAVVFILLAIFSFNTGDVISMAAFMFGIIVASLVYIAVVIQRFHDDWKERENYYG